jgi:hypothetical protein
MEILRALSLLMKESRIVSLLFTAINSLMFIRYSPYLTLSRSSMWDFAKLLQTSNCRLRCRSQHGAVIKIELKECFHAFIHRILVDMVFQEFFDNFRSALGLSNT